MRLRCYNYSNTQGTSPQEAHFDIVAKLQHHGAPKKSIFPKSYIVL